MKSYLDNLGCASARGELIDKVHNRFTSTSTAHGGQESTLFRLYQNAHHFGGYPMASGYTDPGKFDNENPYGTVHVEATGPVGEVLLAAARRQGRYLANLAARLRAGANRGVVA